MKNFDSKRKSLSKRKDEVIEKIDGFVNEHEDLIGFVGLVGAGCYGVFMTKCVYEAKIRSYNSGFNDGMNVYNNMMKELTKMYKGS